MEETDRSRERAELASRVAGAAIQHGLGADPNEWERAPDLIQTHDSVGKEAAAAAMKKGLIKGEDLPSIPFSALHQMALNAASAAIQRGVAQDGTDASLTQEQKHQLHELSILAASAAMQHHYGDDTASEELSEMMNKVSSLAEAAASAAIGKKLVPDERHDPTLRDVAEMARMAASAAIQKRLAEDSDLKKEERQRLATMAARAALQHGLDPDRPNATKLHSLSSISKSAAEAALKKVASRPADIAESDFLAAHEATQFAIDHNLIDHHEPPTELVAEVARMAAAAAIQRGLEDEVIPEQANLERKEFLANIARNAAGFAIRRGHGAEGVPNRRRAYELAVLAASAALRRQEQREEEQQRFPPAQLAEVANRAAREAVRLGFGQDEAELMITPKTPPAADNVTAPADPHSDGSK